MTRLRASERQETDHWRGVHYRGDRGSLFSWAERDWLTRKPFWMPLHIERKMEGRG